MLFPEKLRMGTQSHQLDDICLVVNPYQQKITFDMTFQTAFVIAY